MLDQDKTKEQLIEELKEIRLKMDELETVQISLREKESRCRESEQHLELAVKAGNLGIWDWDLKTGRAIWDEGTVRMIGYERNELDPCVRTWKKLIHLDDWEKVSEVLNAHLSGLIPFYEAEYRMRTKSGEWKWVHIRGKVVEYDKEGKPQRMTGTTHDVTERRQAEELLLESEEKFRSLFENSLDGIFCTAPDGKFLNANAAACRIIGATEQEICASDRDSIVDTNDSRLKAAFEQRTRTGKFQGELMFKRKTGSLFPVDVSSSLFTNAKGETLASIIFRDVSDRVKAEREKRALQSQLFQTQKMEALGTLVGGIAHDFNNMLQIILGYSQLLLNDKKDGDSGYKNIQNIIQAVKGGAELVNKLLAFGQQAPIFPVNMDINQRIRELIPLISRTLPEIVKIDTDLTPRPAMIYADPNQIDQVVMNLAINASEAMPNGGRVKIATTTVMLDNEYCQSHPGVKPGEYVTLSLIDSGRGMNETTLARIFEPFFSTKQRGSAKGTGLGLSVVQGIVEKQGGYISCESQPGKGSEFRVYFPALEAVSTTAKKTSSSPQTTDSKTILVVEDNITIAELEREFLTNADYRVILATNGREALDIYQTRKDDISLVILDLLMPEMSGRDCLMGLVKIDPSVKVLIASGFSPGDELHEEINPLVKGFIQKPFRAVELLEAIRAAF